MRLARTAEPLDTGVAAIAGRTNDAHRKVRLRADIHVKSTMLRAGACGDSRWKDGPCALELDEAVVAARRARSGAARAPTDAAARAARNSASNRSIPGPTMPILTRHGACCGRSSRNMGASCRGAI